MEWGNSAGYVLRLLGSPGLMLLLGDKSNHIPSFHVPQLYYFIAFTSALGWPVLLSSPEGIFGLIRDVRGRMFGSKLWVTS